jgi:hypothetical protein
VSLAIKARYRGKFRIAFGTEVARGDSGCQSDIAALQAAEQARLAITSAEDIHRATHCDRDPAAPGIVAMSISRIRT